MPGRGGVFGNAPWIGTNFQIGFNNPLSTRRCSFCGPHPRDRARHRRAVPFGDPRRIGNSPPRGTAARECRATSPAGRIYPVMVSGILDFFARHDGDPREPLVLLPAERRLRSRTNGNHRPAAGDGPHDRDGRLLPTRQGVEVSPRGKFHDRPTIRVADF